MPILYRLILLFFGLSSFIKGLCQNLPVNDQNIARKYSFVDPSLNKVDNNQILDSFYNKLQRLKQSGKGTVSIVHIGDSHLQAGFISAVIRHGLQDFFGNAGRGIVFPYQLAESNSPEDISCSSNTRWKYNRIAHPEIPLIPGISGFGIESDRQGASFHISLKNTNSQDPAFTEVQLFADNSNGPFLFKPDEYDTSYISERSNDSLYSIRLSQKSTGFFLTNASSENSFSFYGASLLNGNSGLIYHSIGVNGTRFDHYNKATLFWKQLPSLKADLYIISLGTNEAQASVFSEGVFTAELQKFLNQLRKSAPDAAILFTTAPDSYKARKSNLVLKQLNQSIATYCLKNEIPLCDIYRSTGGFGSSQKWSRKGLINRDRVHFTAEGYRVQGNLLLNAVAKGYNDFLLKH